MYRAVRARDKNNLVGTCLKFHRRRSSAGRHDQAWVSERAGERACQILSFSSWALTSKWESQRHTYWSHAIYVYEGTCTDYFSLQNCPGLYIASFNKEIVHDRGRTTRLEVSLIWDLDTTGFFLSETSVTLFYRTLLHYCTVVIVTHCQFARP